MTTKVAAKKTNSTKAKRAKQRADLARDVGHRIGEDHGIGDMLRLVLAPNGAASDDVLSEGIASAADDVRVLAEMANRMRDAVNGDTAQGGTT